MYMIVPIMVSIYTLLSTHAMNQHHQLPVDPDNHFRIGHMGHLNIPMILGTLGAIDTGFKSLNIPHGDNALAAAASSLSQTKA